MQLRRKKRDVKLSVTIQDVLWDRLILECSEFPDITAALQSLGHQKDLPHRETRRNRKPDHCGEVTKRRGNGVKAQVCALWVYNVLKLVDNPTY